MHGRDFTLAQTGNAVVAQVEPVTGRRVRDHDTGWAFSPTPTSQSPSDAGGASLVDDVEGVLLGAVAQRMRLPHVLVDQLGLVVGRSKIAGQLGRVGLRRVGSGRGDVVGLLTCESQVERLAVALFLGRGAEVDRRPGRVVGRWQALLRVARHHLLVERTREVRHALVVEGALRSRIAATHSTPVSTPTLSSTPLPTSWA